MIYKRWQTAAIIIAVCLGVLAALPNLVGPEALRYLPLSEQLYLGLDLKGGTYLQLQVDIPAAERERAQVTQDSVRATLSKAHVPLADLRTEGNAISVRLLDPRDASGAHLGTEYSCSWERDGDARPVTIRFEPVLGASDKCPANI